MRKRRLGRVKRASGGSCAPEIVVKRAPAHASGLRLSERVAFVVVFSLMATFVVGLTVLAAKSGARLVIGRGVPASSTTLAAGVARRQLGDGTGGSGTGRASTGQTGAVVAAQSAAAILSARLAASLRTALGGDSGHLSVGVIDTATGARALYRASKHYDTASIVQTDILAAMLYLDQRSRTAVTATDADLAAKMIESSSDTAATRLWNAIGGGPAIAAANKALKLRQTVVVPAGSLGLTRTTVADQLQLLTDLTARNSALHAKSRGYALGLLAEGAAAARRWGVPAAASPGTIYAATDGWLPDPRLWLADSIGVIQHDGHELLIAVLSKGSPTEADGIRDVRMAAIAAASVIMTGP